MKKLLTIVLLGTVTLGFGQQDVQFTHFKEYALYYNPAYAGVAKNICADLLARHQWVGMEGAPKSYYFDVRYAVGKLHGGIGLSLLQDELGFMKNSEVNVSYAYSKQFTPGKLHIGASIGLKHAFWGTGYIPPETIVDNSIPFGGSSGAIINSNVGVYFVNQKIYMGLSATGLNQGIYKDKTNLFNFQNVRHYYVLAGYKHILNRQWVLEPSVFAKSDATSTQLDLNIKGIFNQRVFGAINYRIMDAISPTIGMIFNYPKVNFIASYSYDVTTSQIKQYSSGSHEIRLSACLQLQEIFPDRYVDPRDLGGL